MPSSPFLRHLHFPKSHHRRASTTSNLRHYHHHQQRSVRSATHGGCKAFDESPDRGEAQRSSSIAGLLREGKTRAALALFLESLGELHLHGAAEVAGVLRRLAAASASDLVPQIHARLLRSGLSSSAAFGHPLMSLYSDQGLPLPAMAVFRELSSTTSVTYLAMLSCLSQNGHADEALLLFRSVLRSSSPPTPYAFSAAITACRASSSGEQLHDQALKLGLLQTCVSNSLISFYSELGAMAEARRVFDETPLPDKVTFNAIISAHARQAHLPETVFFIRRMRELGFSPDAVTLAVAAAGAADLRGGAQLHGLALKAGLLFSDAILQGSLINMYLNCSAEAAAVELGCEVCSAGNQSTVVFNLMLVARGRALDLAGSMAIFGRIMAGPGPSRFTFPSLMRTCAAAGAVRLGEQLQGLTVKAGFELADELVELYAKSGDIAAARRALMAAPPGLAAWTSVVAGYTQKGLFSQALATFKEALGYGVFPDAVALAGAAAAAAGIFHVRMGGEIHGLAVSGGFSGDPSVVHSLISFYAKCGRKREAMAVFLGGDGEDEVAWNALISGLARGGGSEEALRVFAAMNRAGLANNLFACGSAMAAAAELAAAELGRQIHGKMVKSGLERRAEGGNALITLYSKAGAIAEAERVFCSLQERNEVSFNAMIGGYSQHGGMAGAMGLFERMKEEGMRTSRATFAAVLAACSREGKVAEGIRVFQEMAAEHGIQPSAEHEACVVDMLGRAGELSRAVSFIAGLASPDAMVWKALLAACRLHGNVEIGEMAGKRLLELDEGDGAGYVMMAEIYDGEGMWGFRERVREVMREKGAKKEPGWSWIEGASPGRHGRRGPEGGLSC
ncbi:pentatricopeptide repeat-containing protein At4g13650-like [Wolffia australiana]